MNRRDFLKDSAAVGMTLAMAQGASELLADTPKDDAPKAPVSCAVIGLGKQGQEILTSLAKAGSKPKYICDTYTAENFLKKAKAIAPEAKFVEDYKAVLSDPTVVAVFVATPSHKHKQIVLDALAAGKHVYCEAPLASNLEDAKAIAKAGLEAKTIFMPGLQMRSNLQNIHVLKFVRGGALGTVASGRAQHHNKTTWRQSWPDDERMKELNWRLSKATSLGLIGEIGIHQLDTAAWFMKSMPIAVTGYGGNLLYKDGRDVADTVNCTLEFPDNVSYSYDATLTNSFDGAYETFFGSSCAIMLRDQRAWMFKESDSELLGWEVFARKDELQIGNPQAGSGIKTATGIALVADATKQLALGKQPGEVGTDVSKTSLYQSLDVFLEGVRTGVKPEVGAKEGYQATVIAAKANEAVTTGTKITFQKEWFEI